MPESTPIYIKGSLGNAAEMAAFMILISTILAIVVWITYIIVSAILPKKESFTDQQLASQTLSQPNTTFGDVPKGRATSEFTGVPAGRDALFNI